MPRNEGMLIDDRHKMYTTHINNRNTRVALSCAQEGAWSVFDLCLPPLHQLTMAGLATFLAAIVLLAISILADDSARLYLHPAVANENGPVSITPSQVNRILAHHFDVPGENLGASIHDHTLWSWLPSAKATHGKSTVDYLFQRDKQHTFVLLPSVSAEEAQG